MQVLILRFVVTSRSSDSAMSNFASINVSGRRQEMLFTSQMPHWYLTQPFQTFSASPTDNQWFVCLFLNSIAITILRIRGTTRYQLFWKTYVAPFLTHADEVPGRCCLQSCLSVCLFTRRSHVTVIGPWTLDLTIQGTPNPDPPLPTLNIRPHSTRTPQPRPPASDTWWPRLDTFSNLFSWGLLNPTSANVWWLLKHIWLVRGQYASYWKAFL